MRCWSWCNAYCGGRNYNKRFNSFLLSLLVLLLCSCSTLPFSSPPPSTSKGTVTVQKAAPVHITYVAIGASDSYGIGTADPTTQSWPADLTRELQTASSIRLIDLGIPDITVHEALSAELPVALDAHPNLITVWLAVNDLADHVSVSDYARDLNSLLGQLRAAYPAVPILIANVPDLQYVPRFAAVDNQALQMLVSGYNQAIAQAAQNHHVTLVDLYNQWKSLANHPEYISADGFHPSASGYAQIANIFYQKLRS